MSWVLFLNLWPSGNTCCWRILVDPVPVVSLASNWNWLKDHKRNLGICKPLSPTELFNGDLVFFELDYPRYLWEYWISQNLSTLKNSSWKRDQNNVFLCKKFYIYWTRHGEIRKLFKIHQSKSIFWIMYIYYHLRSATELEVKMLKNTEISNNFLISQHTDKPGSIAPVWPPPKPQLENCN